MRTPGPLPAVAAGVGFAAVEALAHAFRPWPLDPDPSALSVTAAAGGLGLVFALAAAFPRHRPWALPAILVAWAAVWGPDGARAGALPAWVGLLPVAALLGAALVSARIALVLTVAGALWVPLNRPRGADSDPAPVSGRSVLLVTVDTVRADAGLLPDSLFPEAGGWHRFSQAVSPAPWTLPSMISMFRGLPVEAHGGGLLGRQGYSTPVTSTPDLAHAFRGAGYRTVAFASNPHLRPEAGFAADFDLWLHIGDARHPLALWHALAGRFGRRAAAGAARADARLVAAALAEIALPEAQPRFVWVHLMLPHEYARAPAPPPGAAFLEGAYASNVAASREHCRALAGAADGFAVAITSDHGEAFGEGGHRGHGGALHDPELRVPLVLRVPGMAGATHEGQVSTADLGRTLLDAAGLGAVELPGRSLLGDPRAEVPVAGVRRHPERAAVRAEGGRYSPAPAPRSGPDRPMRDDVVEEMRALGYLDD